MDFCVMKRTDVCSNVGGCAIKWTKILNWIEILNVKNGRKVNRHTKWTAFYVSTKIEGELDCIKNSPIYKDVSDELWMIMLSRTLTQRRGNRAKTDNVADL